KSYALNRAGMEQIIAGLKRLSLAHIPAHGNFVTFKVADAAGVNQRLLKQGVIVRPIGGYGLPDWLRVTIGTEAENLRFLEALDVALKG
ncbi:MAG: aminotransferase class I/II-fold pyridoxal phosphate-dependent enzyme, partial [Azospira sp.]|nr:aminotransferase class I/II-fold pyridoxal phosphate-dependent enzyme [Azospira sp.]